MKIIVNLAVLNNKSRGIELMENSQKITEMSCLKAV